MTESTPGDRLFFLDDHGSFEIDASAAAEEAVDLANSIAKGERSAGRNEPAEALWRILRESRSPEYVRLTVRHAMQRVLDACVFDAEAATSSEVMRRLSNFVFTARFFVQNLDTIDLGEGLNWRDVPLPPKTAS